MIGHGKLVLGVGAGGYWMMGGPDREPFGYNTSAANATNWATSQAARAVFDVGQSLAFPYIFMDIEAVVPHGWNAGYAGVCSGSVMACAIPAAPDRDTFNGFWDYVENRSACLPGVYDAGGSGPNASDAVFGSRNPLTNTSEWTYMNETRSLSTFPYRWAVNGTVPLWYASAPTQCTLMWQWSGGNGQLNGVGDFDQIDGNRVNSCQQANRRREGHEWLPRRTSSVRMSGSAEPARAYTEPAHRSGCGRGRPRWRPYDGCMSNRHG